MPLTDYVRQRRSYPVQWLIIAALLLIPASRYGWILWRLPHRTHSTTADLRGRPGVQWFLMLHLPDITAQYESGIDTMRGRFDEWLDALAAAGYHPMLLSEVYERLAEDRMLPEKTVVLFFSPAYKTTIDVVGPTLARHGVPAVWITDEHALDRLDRRFVTYEATRRMRRSGLWDVGFADKDETFRLESPKDVKIQLGRPDVPAWEPAVGGRAVNWGPVRSHLNFLAVLADWTAEDLVNRLSAETPMEDPVALVTGQIQNRYWGVAVSTPMAGAPFRLDAPLDKKAARLFWLCTDRRPDFALHLEADRILGELWLRLRYDEDSGNGIFLVFSGGRLIVLERHGTAWSRLLSRDMPRARRPLRGRALNLDLQLRGSRLSVSANGGQSWRVELGTGAPDQGLVELFVEDKMRGVARADGLRMTFAPLIERAAR